jgi:hypothetical protein
MRLLSILAAVTMAFAVGPVGAACELDRVELRGEWGSVRFRAAIADTPEEQSQGLMHVPEMPRMVGMLFVYDRPQPTAFWMRNTLIPLDMLFADETGTIIHIHENAIPLDETPIPQGLRTDAQGRPLPGIEDVQFVLEINGGLSADFGITVGSEMRHPSIPQDSAAWACPAE